MATPPEVDQDQNMYVNFDSNAYLSIPQFYSGRSVFITGTDNKFQTIAE